MSKINRVTASNRRPQAGYMVATALAAVAVIGGAMAMMMTTTKTASQVSQNVSARAKLSADIDTAFNYLANTGTLGGGSLGGVTNMFYAPLPVRTEDMGKSDTPAFIGAIPQLNTVDPRGAMVGYVAFYNGRGARDLYEAQRRSLSRDTQAAEPLFINEDVDMAVQNNNLPALAMIAPGANGRIDLKTENMLKELLLAQDSSGKYQLKSANAMNQALNDAGIDDRVFAYTQQKSRDTQGETSAALVGAADTNQCNPATHKLVYEPRPEGGTQFVCVPETDPVALGRISGNQGVIATLNPDARGNLTLSFDYLQNTALVNRFTTVNNDLTDLEQRINRRIDGISSGTNTTITASGVNLPDINGEVNNPNRGVVFKRLAAGKLEFRTIRSADGNLQVQTTDDEIIIRNTSPASAVEGVNIGGQAPAKNPDELQSKIEAAGLMDTYTNADPITQQKIMQELGLLSSGVRDLYAGKDGQRLFFRRLEAGPGIVFSDGGLDANRQPSIKITADAAAAGALMDVRNVGNGQLLARKNGGLVEIKSLVGINGTIVRTNGSVIEIGAVGGNGGGLSATDVNSLINQYLTGILPSAACASGDTVSFNGTRLICVPGGNFWTRNNDGSITNNNGGNINLAANTSLSAIGGSSMTSFSNNGVAFTGNGNNIGVGSNGVSIGGAATAVNTTNSVVFNRGSLSINQTNGANNRSLFNLDYSGTTAVMTLNGRSIQPMPNTECSASEFLTFRNGEMICAAGGGLGTNNNPVVASSDIITCRSTTPQPIAGNWIKFQFTAADCGGTLPNNTYVGAIKEAVGTNGDGSITVLNAGQAFAGWAPAGIATGAVTGPAVAMTVGAQAGSRVTAVYIRPGSAASVSQDNFDVTFNNAVVDHTITNMANGKYTVTVYGLLGSFQGGDPSGRALRVSMNGVVARLSGFTTEVSQAPYSVTRTVNVTNGQLNVSTLLGWGGIQGINATRIGN